MTAPRKRRIRGFGKIGLALSMMVAVFFVAVTGQAAQAADTVTVNGQSHTLNGTNIYRASNYLVQYTPSYGASTGTNAYGFEAAVVGGKVTTVQDSVGNMAIPSNGYVLSGHGTSRTWLKANATVGATVTIGSGGGGGGGTATEMLPDLGVRALTGFLITTPTSGTLAGRKLLKFPGVSSNIGHGPFEIRGTRDSTSDTTWDIKQYIKMSDGSTEVIAAPGTNFYYAGDGHNHWHVRDVDSYALYNGGGVKLRDGEKHGFCFEDNTNYRDWPSNGTNGAPSSPVYSPSVVCGVGQPSALSVTHGLSVGWGDTYPSSLPDQAIDITGLADGTYTVKVVADQGGWFKEGNESNNTATAKIQIKGNSVSLISNTGL